MARSTVDVDDDLLERAREILGTTDATDTVNAALRDVVERQARQALLDWWASDPLPDLRDSETLRRAWR